MALAVCGGCNAQVAFEAVDCGACGRVFGAAPVKLPPLARDARERGGVAGWMFVASVLMCAVLRLAIPNAHDATYVVAEIFGMSLVPAGIGIAVAAFASRRAGWITFWVIIALVGIGRFGALADGAREYESRSTLARLSAAALARQEQFSATGQVDRLPATAQPWEPGSREDVYAQLVPLIRAYSDRWIAMQGTARRDIDGVGLEQVLAPERLVKRAGIADSRDRLQRYARIMARFNADRVAMTTTLRSDIERIAHGSRDEADMLDTFHASEVRRESLATRALDTDHRLVALTHRMLDFMDARVGHVRLMKGMMVFEAQADVDAYQRMSTDLQSLAAQESALAQEELAILRTSRLELEQM